MHQYPNKIFNLRLIILTFCLFSYCIHTSAQGLRNLFFNSFEDVIRLDFSSDPPTPFSTGIEGSYEGIAHYEDGDGNLLFWFNSGGVYDTNGDDMPGSFGIWADDSSAEICLCPVPGYPNKYYILYNAQTCSSLYYSIVDMTLNGGLGDVTDLNTPISTNNFAEGMEVIAIDNSPNYWLLTYECNVGFVKFLISETGIGNGELITPYPVPPGGFDGRGELDYHKGKFAMTFAWTNQVFVGDFNPIGGLICNPINLNETFFETKPFGVDFSPDGSKIYFSLWYVTDLPNLFQYDIDADELTSFTPDLGVNASPPSGLGQIELGRDGKLYVIIDGGENILVINNPNDSNPTFSTIPIPATTGLGISDHIQSSIFNASAIFLGDTLCGVAGETLPLITPNENDIFDWYDKDNPETVLAQSNNYNLTVGTQNTVYVAAIPGNTGCSDEFEYTILPSPDDLDAGPDQNILSGQTIMLNATTAVNEVEVVWYPNEGMDNANSLTPTVSPTETTTYYVTAQNGICEATDQVTIHVFENGLITEDVCAPVGEEILLSMSDTLTNPTWVVQGTTDVLATDYTFTATTTSTPVVYEGVGTNPSTPNGVTTQVTVLPEAALDAGENLIIFIGESTSLNASGAGNDGYNWQAHASLTGSGANPTVAPTETTTYVVSSATNGLCEVSDSVTVIVINTENTIADSVCVVTGESATLNIAESFTTITWYNAALPETVLANSPTLTITGGEGNDVFLAIAEDELGDITSYYFTLLTNPIIDAGNDVSILENESTILSASGGTNYEWSPTDGLDNPNAATVTAAPTATTTYTLTNTTANGCVNTDQVTVSLRTELMVVVPTGFSPNGDGYNDVLAIADYNVVQLNAFKIYNRWGKPIFESTDLEASWDGTYKGVDAALGVYIYFLQATDRNGKVHTYKGNITLIR